MARTNHAFFGWSPMSLLPTELYPFVTNIWIIMRKSIERKKLMGKKSKYAADSPVE
jgi:hypothetical protein